MLTDKVSFLLVSGSCAGGSRVEPTPKYAGTATRPFHRVGGKCTGIVAKPSGFGVREPILHGEW